MNKAEEFLKSKKIDEGYVLYHYSDDGAEGHKLTELLDEYAQQVAKKQRQAMWDWYKTWMFPDEEIGDNDYVRAKEAFLEAPLVTDNQEDKP